MLLIATHRMPNAPAPQQAPKGKFALCIDCEHANWHSHSPGTCMATPLRGLDMTTMQAREHDFYCGPDGKFWERRHDIPSQ